MLTNEQIVTNMSTNALIVNYHKILINRKSIKKMLRMSANLNKSQC